LPFHLTVELNVPTEFHTRSVTFGAPVHNA